MAGLEAKLAGLKDDLSRLETAQLGIMAGVKDCCKNDSALALLVKAAVQEHMTTVSIPCQLLYKIYNIFNRPKATVFFNLMCCLQMMAGNNEGGATIIGAGVATGSTEEKPSGEVDTTPFMTFLNNHNYAKQDDIDDRIATLTAKLNEQSSHSLRLPRSLQWLLVPVKPVQVIVVLVSV